MATTTKTTKQALTMSATTLADGTPCHVITEDGKTLFVTLFEGKAAKRLANMIAAREAAAA